MDKTTATTVFESLASGVRLDVFRLLVKQGPEGLVAGEIAAALGKPIGAVKALHFRAMAALRRRLAPVTEERR